MLIIFVVLSIQTATNKYKKVILFFFAHSIQNVKGNTI